MKAFLSLDSAGSFPGRYFGFNGSCNGEIAHYRAPYFAPQILTDPSYLGKIVVIDAEQINERWPMPDEVQSFMPHLAGLVFLGHEGESLGAGEHFTLGNYLETNRIPAFLPDNPDHVRRAALHGQGIGGAIGHGRFNSKHAPMPVGFRAIASPQEYIWDLAPGDMPEENTGLVVWDHGVNYDLLRSLKKIGARLRVVPPDSEPEHIIALHPDGVVIAGGPFPAELGETLARIERIIGIRPILAVGNGALLVARAMGVALEQMANQHYGAAMIVNDLDGHNFETYQAHARALSQAALEKAACRVTHLNAADGTVEGFVCPDYDITAALFTMTSEPVPRVLQEYMAGLQKQIAF
jgi:carbamoyl-phosphate synthase small subunit